MHLERAIIPLLPLRLCLVAYDIVDGTFLHNSIAQQLVNEIVASSIPNMKSDSIRRVAPSFFDS